MSAREHVAFEVYEDLLAGVRALAPLLGQAELAPRFIELHRGSHARYSRAIELDAGSIEAVRARLAAFEVTLELPAVVAGGRWRFLLRSLARLERIRALGGPVDLFRDDFLSAARDLGPRPYAPPRDLRWTDAAHFARDAITLAAATGDDVGLGPIDDDAFVALAEPFAVGAEHVTIQSAARPPSIRLPPALFAACDAAARKGHALAGYVEIVPA
ncbi:MAG TPA: hypothetical protein VL463_24115 [Kofleriaceae bacterium]|nr:hypothetical protein [Kofleriaceae bacterium]